MTMFLLLLLVGCSNDADKDGYSALVDCNDDDASVSPSGVEACDGRDNDCDGQVDELGATGRAQYYPDADADGYGDAQLLNDFTAWIDACEAPDGYVANATDCDDIDPGVHPAAEEVCNELDENCDGVADDGLVLPVWNADHDLDSYGDPELTIAACEAPEGYVDDALDCDDDDADIRPGAAETCDNRDNDCDGTIDVDAYDQLTWYLDGDGDGYGDADTTINACDRPEGYEDLDSDCDDNDATIHPDAIETCNGLDDNCDYLIDPGESVDAETWYRDEDGDGYGDPDNAGSACEQPPGYISDDSDCNDHNFEVNPDAYELCDGEDQDCDGFSDSYDVAFDDMLTFYRDEDGDGYGSSVWTRSCSAPVGYSTDSTDCDDDDVDAYPGARELCDGDDDDCDNTIDEGC